MKITSLYEKTELTYPLLGVLMKELTVTGSIDYGNVFRRSLLASRRFDAKALITHYPPIDEIEKGFRTMEKTEHVLEILAHP